MIIPLSLQDVAVSLGACLVGDSVNFDHVSTDSRAIKSGSLFVALRGDKFDGHNFLKQAQASGACAVVVDSLCSDSAMPQLVVADTTRALGEISKLVREQFSGPLIAITGSCGKTTVKEMLAAILSRCGKIHATAGNFNNHIGVPLTLLQLSANDDYSVIEMGASSGGEIEYLTQLAQPNVALVNNIMPAHVEGFGSVDAIARAKAEIYQSLSGDGVAVINLDDRYANDMMCELPTKNHLTFSLFDQSACVHADNIQAQARGTHFTLCAAGAQCDIQLNVIGQHNLANALAAACCALAVGATLEHISKGLEQFKAVSGRLNIVRGVNNCTVIDDSYNANPGSVCAAIDAVKNIHGNKILVLGDMAELGSEAKLAHSSVGDYANSAGFYSLYSVGILSALAAKSFGSLAQSFGQQSELIKHLKTIVTDETVIVIKGSRSAHMEKVAQALTSKNSGAQA
jgi:UDP-N-acetylmuramoyl-tripeptide--D-alanyl-D-alanine ligase|tara:strand:- start:427 stop:1797 length:1371 start_codon:yes stop_codon:yes gene_type:complete